MSEFDTTLPPLKDLVDGELPRPSTVCKPRRPLYPR